MPGVAWICPRRCCSEAGVLAIVMGGTRDGSLLYAGGEDFRVYTVGERGRSRSRPARRTPCPVRALNLAATRRDASSSSSGKPADAG